MKKTSLLWKWGFALCSDGNDVHAHAELLKVNVKVDMQLVVPVDLHPLDKAVDDHFLCLHAGGVVHISPRDNVIVLGVQVLQHSLSFVIGQLRRLKLLLNFETFCLTVRNQRAEQVLRKSTFAAQGFNDLGLQHIQLGRYFCMFGPDAAEQRLPFLHFFFVLDIDDLAFGDSFHTLKDLAHHSGFGLVDNQLVNLMLALVEAATFYEIVAVGNKTAFETAVLDKLAEGGFCADRSLFAFTVSLPEADIVGEFIGVGIETLLTLLGTPDPDAVLFGYRSLCSCGRL